MALYTIELDAATDGKLRSVAARRDVSPEELCGVAIRNLLDAAPLEEPELGEDAYTALWEFVPAKGGPDARRSTTTCARATRYESVRRCRRMDRVLR